MGAVVGIIGAVCGFGGGTVAFFFWHAYCQRLDENKVHETEIGEDPFEECGEYYKVKEGDPQRICTLGYGHDDEQHCDGDFCYNPQHEPPALEPWLLVDVTDANVADYETAAQRREDMDHLTPTEFEREKVSE